MSEGNKLIKFSIQMAKHPIGVDKCNVSVPLLVKQLFTYMYAVQQGHLITIRWHARQRYHN